MGGSFIGAMMDHIMEGTMIPKQCLLIHLFGTNVIVQSPLFLPILAIKIYSVYQIITLRVQCCKRKHEEIYLRSCVLHGTNQNCCDISRIG